MKNEYCRNGCGRKIDSEFTDSGLCSSCLMEQWQQERDQLNRDYERSV